MKKITALIALLPLTLLTSCMTTDAAAAEGSTGLGSPMLLSIGMMVFFVAMMYFVAIRPQKKQEKEQKAMLASMSIGDTVLTTSGFYGVVIDITEDTIIVEFGNNKNCRIPMQKAAVVRLEHPEGWAPQVEAAEDAKDKKDKK